MPMKHSTYSAIIVGSGIAGLYAAIKMSETMDVSCPVIQFIREDFPALRRPKIPMW